MFDKLKHFIEKILSFNIGNLFKFEMNNKIADNQENKLIEINNDNSRQVLQQNFVVTVLPNINIDSSIKSALIKGNENAKEVGLCVEKLLKENNISEEKIQENLSNPEILSTIAKANEIAYKTSDAEKRKILSDLIFNKVKEDVDSNDSIILSLAIREMDILNINHIKALVFLYIIKSNHLKDYSIDNLNDFKTSVLEKLLDFKNSSAKNVGNFLASTRTISDAHLGWGIYSYLPQISETNNSYSKVILEEFKELSNIWEDLRFTGSYLTPVGEYIAKIYLFNNFGIVIENKKQDENNTKDLSDDVSAKELNEVFAEAAKNMISLEEIETIEE